jgi:predicted RecA/RadA family phage recombinase
MDTDSRKVNCQSPIQLHASLDSIDKLGDIRMARVEAGVRIDNANNWSREGIFAIPKSFDKDFAEEEGEVRVTV